MVGTLQTNGVRLFFSEKVEKGGEEKGGGWREKIIKIWSKIDQNFIKILSKIDQILIKI